MGNEMLAIYIIGFEKYTVYGCWDNDTLELEYDFFDVYDENGECINEGNPFWEFPTRQEIKEYVKTI